MLILAVVCCAIGCLLLASTKLVDTELDLFTYGIAINGIGIALFLYSQGQKSKNAE
ncbi:MAG: hypothetical protein AAGI38_18715 [Bacteroidota bacterium]